MAGGMGMTETGGTAGLALVRVSFHSLALLLLYFRLSFRVLVHFAFFPGVALVSDSALCISHFPSTRKSFFFFLSAPYVDDEASFYDG